MYGNFCLINLPSEFIIRRVGLLPAIARRKSIAPNLWHYKFGTKTQPDLQGLIIFTFLYFVQLAVL